MKCVAAVSNASIWVDVNKITISSLAKGLPDIQHEVVDAGIF
jgi:hypothetical protein